jgi:hypothetical protein
LNVFLKYSAKYTKTKKEYFSLVQLKILLGHNNSDVPTVTFVTKVVVYLYFPDERGTAKPPISALPFCLSGEDQFKRKIDSSEKGEGCQQQVYRAPQMQQEKYSFI